jgi:hypothetical protein
MYAWISFAWLVQSAWIWYLKLFAGSGKNLKIMNLGDAQGTSGVAAALEGSDDEGVDPHLNRIRSARESGAAPGEDSDEEVCLWNPEYVPHTVSRILAKVEDM